MQTMRMHHILGSLRLTRSVGLSRSTRRSKRKSWQRRWCII